MQTLIWSAYMTERPLRKPGECRSMTFSVRERAKFNKSHNLIGSGCGRNFLIRPLSAEGIVGWYEKVSKFAQNYVHEIVWIERLS